ncbi:MAG: tRNA (adenosine(37)-N6)-threonylcarbamoyltransferase complex ATPase subunit type 1 TsaE, partial [Geminicoccaceae bacterium]|nr:tRNA (adenosine(37)-N6)-threonylcarbamoyltransferase complex ATPase subunit type 1 TsaE [Geminicoccaceae bacterium]
MYLDFYRLTGRPFQLTPDHAFYYGSRSHRRAVAYLSYGLQQGEGFIVVTGEVGAGKTTLVHWLAAQLGERRVLAPSLPGLRIGPEETLAAVGQSLGAEASAGGQVALLRAIEARLRELAANGRRVLLVVDEAQNLGVEALEALRSVSNLGDAGRAVVQILLVGQPQFRAMLARPELAQLRERIVASYHLGPLEADEVQAYIEHRLARVGWQGDPRITVEACRAIHAATGGLPRRINLLCARLLVLGALEERHELDRPQVEEVADEMRDELATAPDRSPLAARRPTSGGELASDEPLPDSAIPAALRARTATAESEEPVVWQREVGRLLRRLEAVLDDLARERHRREDAEAEVCRLRSELHRLELGRLQAEVEATRRLAELVDPPFLLFLRGELGAGKTTLARGMLRGLGHRGPVRSPSFTLLESYDLPDRTVHHLDVYRV